MGKLAVSQGLRFRKARWMPPKQQCKKALCSCSQSSWLPVLTREVLACPGHLRLCFAARPEAPQPTWLCARVPGRAGCGKLAAPGPPPSGPVPPPVPRAHLTPTDGVRLPAEISEGPSSLKTCLSYDGGGNGDGSTVWGFFGVNGAVVRVPAQGNLN